MITHPVGRRAAILGLAAATAPFVARAQAKTKIRVGFAGFSVSAMPIYAAIGHGFFDAENIDYEEIQFKGGAPALQAMVGGSTEFMDGGAEHVLRLNTRNFHIVDYLALTDTHSYVLMGLASQPATDIKGLKGKNLGITAPASTTDSTLRWEIAKLGLDPDTDYQIIGVGQGGEMRSAIDSGSVAAGMVIFAEAVDMMLQNGKYKIIRDYRDMPYPGAVLLGRTQWLQDNPAPAKAFARAILKGTALLQHDPAAAKSIVHTMFPTFGTDFVEAMAAAAVTHLSADGRTSRAAIENMVGIMHVTEPDLKPMAYEQITTDLYLPSA